MDNSREFQQIKYKVEDVIRDLTSKKDMSIHDLEALTKSVCLLEKVKAIEEGGNDEGGGYSERGMSRNSYRNEMYNPMHEREYAEGSYRRGRSPVTGQYVSRDGGSGTSNRGYYDGGTSNRGSYEGGGSSRRYYDGGSRNSGYSGHSMRDRAIAKLEEMYDEAQTEHERRFLDEWIGRLSR